MMADAVEQELLEDAVFAANETQAEAFWQLRDSIAPAEKERGPAVQHDISVAVELMPEFVDAVIPEVEAAWPGTQVVAFGHLGDGNVHFHVIAPGIENAERWFEDQGSRISSQIYDLVTAWGGSISAEHGIGQLKRGELARLGDPVALSMMAAVKQALDPKGLLNPGKLV
jgi:FAD/FMN-containing dehydrogenase